MAQKLSIAAWGGRVLLSIAALLFLGFSLFVAGQVWRGKVAPDDLLDVLFVLRGDKRYAMNLKQIMEYRQLLEEKGEAEKKATEQEGEFETRVTAAQAAKEAREIQEENYAVLQASLKKEQQKLKALTSEYERLKAEVEATRKLNETIQQQDQSIAAAKRSEELKKTLANMDAADVGQFLEVFMAQNQPEVAADYLLRYTKPDFRAEVLTEMTPDGRQKILPMLAYKYAGLSPSQVLERWNTQEHPAPEVMGAQLRKMPSAQAFGVYFLLDPATRTKLAPHLQSQ